MTRLEDELRDTFAARVAEVPSVRDIAGSAIARGRVVRRRQRFATGAAFAVVIALVASGTWWAQLGRVDTQPGRRIGGVAAPSRAPSGPAAGPARSAPVAAAQLDLVVGGELRPAGRAPIALPGTGDVYDAVRVSEGWFVVRGTKFTQQLWLVPPQGAATLLISALPAGHAFSGDGRRIAFQQDSTLTVATLAGGKATAERVVQLPGQNGDQGRNGAELAGWAGRYVAIGNRLGIGYIGFDVWDPDRGPYTTTWNPDVVGVYGATPDGRSVLGAVSDPAGGGKLCTAVLDPGAKLQVRAKVCGQSYLYVGWHGASPDGRWMVSEEPNRVVLVDAATGAPTFSTARTQSMWGRGPAWIDNHTFATTDGDHIRCFDVNDLQHPREVPAPSTSEPWLVVPRVGG